MVDLETTLARARTVSEDCATVAAAVDRTPFTPKGIGTTFGNVLAEIASLAKCIEELTEAVRDRR